MVELGMINNIEYICSGSVNKELEFVVKNLWEMLGVNICELFSSENNEFDE